MPDKCTPKLPLPACFSFMYQPPGAYLHPTFNNVQLAHQFQKENFFPSLWCCQLKIYFFKKRLYSYFDRFFLCSLFFTVTYPVSNPRQLRPLSRQLRPLRLFGTQRYIFENLILRYLAFYLPNIRTKVFGNYIPQFYTVFLSLQKHKDFSTIYFTVWILFIYYDCKCLYFC